eukprot:SAG22_NODE_9535_length_584_cov_1.375258_2_plen_57_part_01
MWRSFGTLVVEERIERQRADAAAAAGYVPLGHRSQPPFAWEDLTGRPVAEPDNELAA